MSLAKKHMKSYPLLQSQLGVFYDCLKYPQVMQYNIPCIVPLTDDIDCDRVEVARAVMLLATSPRACTVFHPYNIHRQYLSDILNGFAAAGISLRHVEKEEFQEALQRMMDNPDLVGQLRPLMVYDLSSTHQMRWIEADNEYTTQVLYRYGFQWPITARSYVHRFVDTIIGFDYFKS